MPLLTRIAPGEPLPPTHRALEYPNGLLAVGMDLTTERLLEAYARGVFPWFEEGQPVLWWTPDPRSVMTPASFHCSRSLRRTLRRNRFRLSADRHFETVMRACAAPREGQDGTWINPAMIAAYRELHALGHAHSVEVLTPDGELVGGLYGVAMGRVFFGESMFSRAPDASKVAFAALVHVLRRQGFELIDCQVESDHLNSLGARNISRMDFEQRLAQTVNRDPAADDWSLPEHCGELL
jgi:leucyl/phenylalanyl-tRNA--protein transferase